MTMLSPDYESISCIPVQSIINAMEKQEYVESSHVRRKAVTFSVPLKTVHVFVKENYNPTRQVPNRSALKNKQQSTTLNKQATSANDLEKQLVQMARSLEKEVSKAKRKQQRRGSMPAYISVDSQATSGLETEILARLSNLEKSSSLTAVRQKMEALRKHKAAKENMLGGQMKQNLEFQQRHINKPYKMRRRSM